MPTLHALAEIMVRAARLFALAVAPPLLSPAPLPSASPLVEAALAMALLTAVVVAAARLRTRLDSKYALASGGLPVLAVTVAIVYATLFRGAAGPLGRGVLWVAVPLWSGLAITTGVVAERRLGGSFRHSRLVASALVLCGGAAVFASQSGWLFSARQMWWQALRKDGANGLAADAIVRASLQKRDDATALEVLDRCLVVSPDSCACLARRVHVRIRMGAGEEALGDAREAIAACPDDPTARVAQVAARSYLGDAAAAEVEARAAIAQRELPSFHYALALALDRQGQGVEALQEAERAVGGGAGRDAALLLGALAIRGGALDVAEKALAPLVATSPDDAEAQYNLALIAHRRDRYNEARQGYLAALRADPTMADARFNLVDLTLRHHVIDEARHHARKFAEARPNDPRNAVLTQRIAAAAAAR